MTEEMGNNLVEFEDERISQHNGLLLGIANMSLTSQKIFELAVSKVYPKNPPKDRTVVFSDDEIFDFFGTTGNSRLQRISKHMNELVENASFSVLQKVEKGLDYILLAPIEKIVWNDYNDKLAITFTPSIMPYLTELEDDEGYTHYLLSEVQVLESSYSIMLFKWIVQKYNIYQTYHNPLHQYPKVTVDDLRILTNTKKKYARFDNWERRVLKRSIEEINEKTNYKITYRKLYKGNEIGKIEFNINKSKVPYDKTFTGNKQIDTTEEELLKHFPEAIDNPYVVQLIERKLLKFNDKVSISKIFINLSPLYEALDHLYKDSYSYGQNNLTNRHFKYIEDSIKEITNKRHSNIYKYLLESFEGFYNRVSKDSSQFSAGITNKRIPEDLSIFSDEYSDLLEYEALQIRKELMTNIKVTNIKIDEVKEIQEKYKKSGWQ